MFFFIRPYWFSNYSKYYRSQWIGSPLVISSLYVGRSTQGLDTTWKICLHWNCIWKFEYFKKTHPSPVKAQHAWMCHWCFLIDVKSSCLEISAADIDPFKSWKYFFLLNFYKTKQRRQTCLLAYTRTLAFAKSSCWSILYNSSLLTANLSLSVESMTIMMNCGQKVGFRGKRTKEIWSLPLCLCNKCSRLTLSSVDLPNPTLENEYSATQPPPR